MKKIESNEMYKMDFEKASPKELKEFFDFFDKETSNTLVEIGAGDMTDTKKLSYTTCRKGREFYAQRYTNGELRYIITELKDGQGIGIEKGGKYGVKNGYIRIIKGDLKKDRYDAISGIHGNDICYYDKDMNLLVEMIIKEDTSHEVRKFEDGKLKSTSFYDKDNNLIKRINKKGDAERRKTSDDLDALNEMAPSGLRQRLKRETVATFREKRKVEAPNKKVGAALKKYLPPKKEGER